LWKKLQDGLDHFLLCASPLREQTAYFDVFRAFDTTILLGYASIKNLVHAKQTKTKLAKLRTH